MRNRRSNFNNNRSYKYNNNNNNVVGPSIDLWIIILIVILLIAVLRISAPVKKVVETNNTSVKTPRYNYEVIDKEQDYYQVEKVWVNSHIMLQLPYQNNN